MASDRIPGKADVRADDPDIVDRKVLPAMVGNFKGKTMFQAGEHRPSWDMEKMVDEEWRGDCMALQELGYGITGYHSFRKSPVVWHEEGDIVYKEANWGHVDQHYKGEVVGLLHLLNGHNKVLVSWRRSTVHGSG